MRAKPWGDNGLKDSIADKEKSHVSGVVAVQTTDEVVVGQRNGQMA